MLRRKWTALLAVSLALTFGGAKAFAGHGDCDDHHGHHGHPYGSYRYRGYHGGPWPHAHYGGYHAYRNYYRGGWGYPPSYYYGPAYPPAWGYYGPRNGVTFSFGF